MNCQEQIDFLCDYVSGDLTPDVLLAFEEHLGECEDCAAYLAMYRSTVTLGRECAAPDDLATPPEELVRAILAARPTESADPA